MNKEVTSWKRWKTTVLKKCNKTALIECKRLAMHLANCRQWHWRDRIGQNSVTVHSLLSALIDFTFELLSEWMLFSLDIERIFGSQRESQKEALMKRRERIRELRKEKKQQGLPIDDDEILKQVNAEEKEEKQKRLVRLGYHEEHLGDWSRVGNIT